MNRTFWRDVPKKAALVYLLFRTIFAKRNNKECENVLIIHGGNIGDGLLRLPAVIALKEHFISKGKKVYFMCPKISWNVLRKVPEAAIGVNFVDALPKNTMTFKNIRNIRAALKGIQYDAVVAFALRGWAWRLLATSLDSNNVYTMEMPKSKSVLNRLMGRFIYSYATLIPDDVNMCTQTKDAVLLARIGIKDYITYIPHIPKQCQFKCTSNDYIVLSVDSSIPQRRWPAERFVMLANYLLESTDYDVVLTGYNVPEEDINEYKSAFSDCERVTDLIKITNTEQWIEVIRGGAFLVGVDSGSIHIAASVGTLSFCLTGAWDGRRFLPYNIGKETSNTVEPICIMWEGANREDLFCYDCFSKGSIGKGNALCEMRCKEGKPCVCLENISVNDVITVIESSGVLSG